MVALCVVTQWKNAKDRQARIRLIWTQALHWLAILVTMNLVLLTVVRQMLPAPAISQVLLTLLALGTFLAGVNLLSLQICFLGLAMALAVPAIAWFKQSALFLALGAIFVVGLGMAFWPRRGTPSENSVKQIAPSCDLRAMMDFDHLAHPGAYCLQLTRPMVVMVVALDDCTRSVTMAPQKEPRRGVAAALLSTERSAEPASAFSPLVMTVMPSRNRPTPPRTEIVVDMQAPTLDG
jgi:hypothetical protein